MVKEFKTFKAIVNGNVERVSYDSITLKVEGKSSEEALRQYEEFKDTNEFLLKNSSKKDSNLSLHKDLESLEADLNNIEDITNKTNLPKTMENAMLQNNTRNNNTDYNAFETVGVSKFIEDLNKPIDPMNKSIPPSSKSDLFSEILGKNNVVESTFNQTEPKDYVKTSAPYGEEETIIQKGPKKMRILKQDDKLKTLLKSPEIQKADTSVAPKGPTKLPNHKLESLESELNEIKSAAEQYSEYSDDKEILKETLESLHRYIGKDLSRFIGKEEVRPLFEAAVKFQYQLEDMIKGIPSKPKRTEPYSIDNFAVRLKRTVAQEEIPGMVKSYEDILNLKNNKVQEVKSEKLINWFIKSNSKYHDADPEYKDSKEYQLKVEQLRENLNSFKINPSQITAPAKTYTVQEFEKELKGIVKDSAIPLLTVKYKVLLSEQDPVRIEEAAKNLYHDITMAAYKDTHFYSKNKVTLAVNNVLPYIDSHLANRGIKELSGIEDTFNNRSWGESSALSMLARASHNESIKGGKK